MTNRQRVLNWCNKRSTIQHTELQKGVPGMACECPITNSTDAHRTTMNYIWFKGRMEHIPKYIREFILAFDAEKFPELIL